MGEGPVRSERASPSRTCPPHRNGSKGVEAEALAARLAAALSEMAPRASPGAAGAGAGAGVRAPWGEAEDLARLLSLALARG